MRRRDLSIGAAILLIVGAVALLRWNVRLAPKYLLLPDGTEVFFRSDTQIDPAPGYPHPREIRVNGDVLFRTPASDEPLTLRSKLLALTVTGKAALRVTAYAREDGEQAQVLYGNVSARKNYASPYDVADTLSGGQMVMVNRSIDLMEKENAHPEELRDLENWSSAIVAAAKAAK